jgi:hypothetical protein
MADGRENLIRKAIRDTKELSVASTTLLSSALSLRLMILRAELLRPDSGKGAICRQYHHYRADKNRPAVDNWSHPDLSEYGIEHRTRRWGLAQKHSRNWFNTRLGCVVMVTFGGGGMTHVHWIFTYLVLSTGVAFLRASFLMGFLTTFLGWRCFGGRV